MISSACASGPGTAFSAPRPMVAAAVFLSKERRCKSVESFSFFSSFIGFILSWRCRRVYELKDQFQSELNLARRADDAGDGSGIAGANGRVRQIELRRVEEVEKFGAELEIQALGNVELLEEREIKINPPRAVKNVAAR